MKTHRLDKLKAIILYSEPRIIELFLFLAFMLCSFVLFYNQNLFGQSVSYASIRDTKEWWWGLGFLTIGLVKLFGLLYDKENIRRLICYIGTALWIYMEILVLSSPVFGLITVLFTLCTLMQAYVFFRINIISDQRRDIRDHA